jgi:hypothetical protein
MSLGSKNVVRNSTVFSLVTIFPKEKKFYGESTFVYASEDHNFQLRCVFPQTNIRGKYIIYVNI